MPDRLADDQFSIKVASAAYAQALADHIRQAASWLDVVPGVDSVVVRFDASRDDASVARQHIVAASQRFSFDAIDTGTSITIPVQYGGDSGPDLAGICSQIGISESEFIELHTAMAYPVEMLGFTPGFAFIGGLQEKLRVPRRREPRQRVPAGSVAIADSRTGLYALASPGGWNIVGHTDAALFDPDRDDPFLVAPGMRVRFTAT